MNTMKTRRFQKKFLIFIIPAILLLVLLLAAAPGAIYRELHYRSAVKALHSGDLVRAEVLFSDIPLYRDSETMVHAEIPYLQAKSIMAAAESGDKSALEAAGYTSSDLNKDNTVSMLLYQAALDMFRSLDDYKDSAAQAAECQAGVDREVSKLKKQAEEALLQKNQEAYDRASSLLEEGAYSKAISVFRDLGSFKDSEAMVSECRYRKAVSIFHFLSSYDVTHIYASISTEADGISIFSLSAAEALRLGSGCVDELRSACGKDKTDIRLEDSPNDQLAPLKSALIELFASLEDYADCASYLDRIEEETDYTRDFFMLCSTGDLHAAQDWLYSFDGEFSDRDRWDWLLNLYLPYCGNWDLYLGDSSLLAFTVDQSFTALSVSSRVILTKDSATLRLNFGDGYAFNFDLPSNLGETLFISDLDTGYYMAALNNGHFVYMRYDKDWHILSSCDFIPA